MSRVHNPAHSGKVLREWFPEGITISQAAEALQMNRATLSKLLNGKASATADIALRLAAWLGTSPDLWMGTQVQWDLWKAQQQPRPDIKPLGKHAA